jgi:peptidoglycan/LPS O-acetylase OafA/YrhL
MPAAAPPVLPRPRHHALDALRAAAMLLGIVLHAAISFTTVFSYVWAVQDRERSVVADWLFHGLHCFRMPLFFLVSGFFARMVVARAGHREFLRRRWRRVGVPLLLGLVTIMPATKWAEERARAHAGGPPVSLFEPRFWNDREAYVAEKVAEAAANPAPPRVTAAPFLPAGLRFFALGQLWFLWYLLVFAVVGPALVRQGARLLGPRRRGRVDAAARAALTRAWGPLLLAAPAYPFMLLMFGLEIGTPFAVFVPFPFFMLVPEVNLLGLYLVYFLAGWLAHRHADLLGGPARWWAAWLAAGGAAFAAAYLMTDGLALAPSAPGYWRTRFAALAVYSVATAALSLGFLGLFQRCFPGESRAGRYVADAAYWMYLAHLPVVFLAQARVADWPAPWWLKMTLVSVLAAACCLVTYHFGVRGRWLGRLLNGAPARPPAAPRAA